MNAHKLGLAVTLLSALFFAGCETKADAFAAKQNSTKTAQQKQDTPGTKPGLDTARYQQLVKHLANGDTSGRWPVKNEPLPLAGAVLPFNRVIAYYGNIVNNRMGALGKWPKKEMIPRLLEEVRKWNEADSTIKSIPALHYIAVTAQGSPIDGKWRLRLPHKHIDTVLNWAKEINAQVFLDVQVGLSDVQTEVPLLEKYLSMPNVHFGIDPEFAMKGKGNARPGSVIGTLDAKDINWVSNYLAGLVKKHNLPPKMFMVHRFTQGMVTNVKDIKLLPELQIIIDMDGWGPPAKKKSTYYSWIYPEPVQFTGFKLFYVNDTEYSDQKEMMSREEILKLKPAPIYIQYQ